MYSWADSCPRPDSWLVDLPYGCERTPWSTWWDSQALCHSLLPSLIHFAECMTTYLTWWLVIVRRTEYQLSSDEGPWKKSKKRQRFLVLFWLCSSNLFSNMRTVIVIGVLVPCHYMDHSKLVTYLFTAVEFILYTLYLHCSASVISPTYLIYFIHTSVIIRQYVYHRACVL